MKNYAVVDGKRIKIDRVHFKKNRMYDIFPWFHTGSNRLDPSAVMRFKYPKKVTLYKA